VSPTRVCSVGDVSDGGAARFVVEGRPVAVVRLGDDWYAIGDTCTHQKISLAEGEVHADRREIECWKHGSCFSLETGQPSSLPATRPEPIFTVSVQGDDVLVDIAARERT